LKIKHYTTDKFSGVLMENRPIETTNLHKPDPLIACGYRHAIAFFFWAHHQTELTADGNVVMLSYRGVTECSRSAVSVTGHGHLLE